MLIIKVVLSVNPARKQQVSSVPAKHLFHDRVLWLRRRLNLVFSDFMRRFVSHRSGMRAKAMPPACFLIVQPSKEYGDFRHVFRQKYAKNPRI